MSDPAIQYLFFPMKCLIKCPGAWQGRHFQTQPGISTGSSEHGQYSASQAAHGPYGLTQPQHASPFAPGQPVPVSYASSSQLRGNGLCFECELYFKDLLSLLVLCFLEVLGWEYYENWRLRMKQCSWYVQKTLVMVPSLCLGASAFQAMQYLPHQQQGYAVHSHFTSQPGMYVCPVCVSMSIWFCCFTVGIVGLESFDH